MLCLRIIILSFVSVLLVSSALAEGTSDTTADASREEILKNCSPYRAKREGVPVYRKPDESSEVLAKLIQGELVCYIGEQSEFAIIDWRRQDLLNEREESKEKAPELAFVRLTELWEGPDRRPKDIGEQAQEYFDYIRYGGVPDDVFAPFRPFISIFRNEPKCLAGKICEKIEQQQKAVDKKGK